MQSTLDTVADLERQLSMKLSERDKLEDDLSRMNTRLRSAARGYFGPDSTEYEQLGGTRASARRKYSRRPAVVTEVAAKA